MSYIITDYLKLTKPIILLLVGFTALCGISLVQALNFNLVFSIQILLSIALAGAGANILNQYLERDLDAQMERTRLTRPLPLSKISPVVALWVGILFSVVSTLLLGWLADWGAAALSAFTILFYIFAYTLTLKKTHHYGVVIGGIAGATSPLIASMAITHQIDALPLWLVFLMFMWQPPHFWALCLVIQEDYRRIRMPMLPLVKGEARTKLEILIYTVLLVPITFFPHWMKWTGTIYFYFALLSTAVYLIETFIFVGRAQGPYTKRLFWVSILFLFLICLGLMIDSQYYR